MLPKSEPAVKQASHKTGIQLSLQKQIKINKNPQT